MFSGLRRLGAFLKPGLPKPGGVRLSSRRGKPKSDECRQWVKDLAAAGVLVFVPEIADCEVRRKLIHIRVSVANIIDVKFADSDQLIRGFGGNHHQLA
jgi:hypothetical protein